ncbi:hypothetical protein [Schleiferilactobacillus shenzhenensis]|uniref:Uncharacterized protein n=1 Tax=Schleiferilactobacillus shenzhenensis LY-73 TaxID=1231336 RepID=U4TSV1_9LACO|nr:hypothetical protein [Schleiferilactobacillus shenzhenensis]ERL64953.1 hypothetical protein L248_3115 [Schleiferilactobacillus shenzhenensis LY-73]
MMIRRFHFHLKRFPWPLLAAILGTLILMIAIPAHHLITPYPGAQNSTGKAIQFYSAGLETVVSTYSPRSHDANAQTLSSRERHLSEENFTKIRQSLLSREYAIVNTLILRQVQAVPTETIGLHTVLMLPFWESFGSQQTTVNVAQVYQYLTARHLTETPMVSERSDAVNVVAHVLGTHGSDRRSAQLILYCVLAAFCLVFGWLFTVDARQKTMNFIAVQPQPLFRYQMTQAGLMLLTMNVLFFAAVSINVAIVVLSPNHNLGNLLYPVTYVVKSKTVLLPIWQYFLLWALLINLWGVFLAGASLLFSLWVKNPLVIIFITAVVAFAQPLQLLALIPTAWQLYFPASATAIPQMFFQLEQFAAFPITAWTLPLLLWSLIVWAAAAAIMHHQAKPRSSR